MQVLKRRADAPAIRSRGARGYSLWFNGLFHGSSFAPRFGCRKG